MTAQNKEKGKVMNFILKEKINFPYAIDIK